MKKYTSIVKPYEHKLEDGTVIGVWNSKAFVVCPKFIMGLIIHLRADIGKGMTSFVFKVRSSKYAPEEFIRVECAAHQDGAQTIYFYGKQLCVRGS